MKDILHSTAPERPAHKQARRTKNETQERIEAESERLLSRRQVAARHGVSVETIKRLEKKGLLQAIRFNQRLIRYRLSDLLTYEQQAVGGSAQ